MADWSACRKGACHRHKACTYTPCLQDRGQVLKVGDVVALPPKVKPPVKPSRNADVGGKAIRGAFCNGRGNK